VAKTGSITRASEQLNLTPQTISGQISLFEQTYGNWSCSSAPAGS
jgi:LysR family transcriptional activator of nhaA